MVPDPTMRLGSSLLVQVRFGSSVGRLMPCSSKYLSSASSCLQLSSGSQVVSPMLHCTLNSSFLPPTHWWLLSSSTNHSWSSAAPKSYGSGWTQFGNIASLDTWYGRSSDTWNVGTILCCCNAAGNSRVYVDVLGSARRTLYGPTYFGHNLCALPFGKFRFLVDRYMRLPCDIIISS
jgi:hypothetical protein